MSHVFEVTDTSEDGKNRFNHHVHGPFASMTRTQVGRVPILLGKVNIGKDNQVVAELIDKTLKGRAVIDIGGGTVPVHNLPQMVVDKGGFAANHSRSQS